MAFVEISFNSGSYWSRFWSWHLYSCSVFHFYQLLSWLGVQHIPAKCLATSCPCMFRGYSRTVRYPFTNGDLAAALKCVNNHIPDHTHGGTWAGLPMHMRFSIVANLKTQLEFLVMPQHTKDTLSSFSLA